MSNSAQIIVIGGGLSGLSAAHTILERGGNVLLLDKNSFLGGNSTKATSGINGSGTRAQKKLKIEDSNEDFYRDTALSATKGDVNAKIHPLGKVLVDESSDCVHWLEDNFGLNLNLVSRLGGHSHPRTHRGPERFPGMTITYALMEKFEKICEEQPKRARLVIKARANKLLRNDNGEVYGVKFTSPDGEFTEYGPVVIATGGYASDFNEGSVLMKYRPDLKNLPTTNGDHCTGDGIKMGLEIGAGVKDMEYVQVHPTGLVHPEDPNAKVLWLAAEALRGVGGIMLDGDGNRFVDELGRRDFVSEQMGKNKGPFWLILNGGASNEIEWHCKHYLGRGLFRRFESAEDLARGLNIPFSRLQDTLNKYNEGAKNNKDQFGRKFFKHTPWKTNDFFHVGQITPVVHYCMGGLSVAHDSQVLDVNGKPIPGLWAAGEVMGGTHGKNRLGGSSLLDCVVFGRVSGRNAASYLLSNLSSNTLSHSNQLVLPQSGSGFSIGTKLESGGVTQLLTVDPNTRNVSFQISWDKGTNPSLQISQQKPQQQQTQQPQQQKTQQQQPQSQQPQPQQTQQPQQQKNEQKTDTNTEYTMEEVGKHKTEKDCWVVVNGTVLNVTDFLGDHPGGKKSILLFAGKDASEEFNMLHKPEVIPKYAPYAIIGKLKIPSKL